MFSVTPLVVGHGNLIFHRNPKFFSSRSRHSYSYSSFTIRSSSSSSSSSLQEIERPIRKGSEEKKSSPKPYDLEPFPPIRAAKRVVLVRHGQSTWNEEGRIQGSSDYSILTQKGESQAQTSRQMLIGDSFDVCFSSPLARSKRTAEIIWDARKEEIITDYNLREIDLYSFQGLLKHEGKAKFGDAYHQWQIDAANFNIDGHYPVRELWARAKSCWTKILTHESSSILVVAHNAVNQALIATAIGLGTEYFRILLQSNCGVSVLDFTPQPKDGSPLICLNRLNQTPSSPIAAGSSGGRKASNRIILVCQGSTLQTNSKTSIPLSGDEPMSMLGIIQSQKTAEFLLDLKVNAIVYSPNPASNETAKVISRVQEAADSLGADSAPHYVDMKQMEELEVESALQRLKNAEYDGFGTVHLEGDWLNELEDDGIRRELWEKSRKAWKSVLDEVLLQKQSESDSEVVVVVVGHPALHIALMGHCLNLRKEQIGSFHLDAGSVSVIEFPDGPAARGVLQCMNYTEHLGRWSIPITTRSTNTG